MAPKATATTTVNFTVERETKNKVRFAEDGKPESHHIGTLYVSKATMAKMGNPESISVTIKAA
jgi:hypothetical protein